MRAKAMKLLASQEGTNCRAAQQFGGVGERSRGPEMGAPDCKARLISEGLEGLRAEDRDWYNDRAPGSLSLLRR